MAKTKPASIINYFSRVFDLLPEKRKKQFYILLIGMVALALFETTALGIISLFATSIATPQELLNSSTFQKAVGYLPIEISFTPETLITALSIAVVGIAILKNASRGFVHYWVTRYGAAVQGYIGERLLERYLAVDYEWHLKQNAHDLLVTLGWRAHFGKFFKSSLTMVSDGILVLIMLTSITLVQPVMMLFVISILGIASFVIYSIMRKAIDKTSKEVRELTRGSALDAAKTVMGMKDVRIFGLETFFLKDFSIKVHRIARVMGTQQIYSMTPTWIMEVIGFSIVSAAIVLMLYILDFNRLEVFGTISLLAVTAWRVLPAINRILHGFTTIRTTIPFLERVLDFLDEIVEYMQTIQYSWKPRLYDRVNPGYMQSEAGNKAKASTFLKEKIEFTNLSFVYGNSQQKALNSIDCTIERGASVGLIGHSGAGKSTFVDLFIGLLRSTEGDLLIDGKQCDDALIRQWRQQIGYVPQFPYIYDCSLAENVAFGETIDSIDEERVLAVCKQASIDFLDDLEKGIYTRIGDRGMRLSGGQRQRVAIARALYNQPEVLVFDEATSSLDTRSEKEIKDTIDSFKGKQTLLIIAHRLTTVEDCDYLIWLEKGKLIEIGSPEDILPKYKTVLESI